MDKSCFIARRTALAETLPDGAALLMFAGRGIRKTADETYPFFTNRNFLYLTGIRQEQTALLVSKRDGEVRTRVFTLMPDEGREVWTGRRFSPEELAALSGIEEILSIDSLSGTVHQLMCGGKYDTLWLCLDTLEPAQPEDLEHAYARRVQAAYPGVRIQNIYPRICAMRRFKSEEELAAIRSAMALTDKGIRRMMRLCRPGLMEYQLEAEFAYELAQNGQRSTAFPSIVAAGARNFYLHYPLPMQRIEDGELVLTDVGAPYDDYCTDISRVFPANGTFSGRQADIYRVALEANRAVMEAVRPGRPFGIANEVCRRVSFEGLKALGLITDFSDVGSYVWHGTTHHVGLDTHDVGGYEEPMAEGMVFTVDAGIYVREWGVGLRIEDNVLVTRDGCENLSAGIPWDIKEIEAMVGADVPMDRC